MISVWTIHIITIIIMTCVYECDLFREYQTLAGRFRPEMFMSTSGGFLLTGIYIGTIPGTYPFSGGVPVHDHS